MRFHSTFSDYIGTAALTSASLDRTQKVKDARSEAQKEIEEYKRQKEQEFKRFESEVRPLGLFTL